MLLLICGEINHFFLSISYSTREKIIHSFFNVNGFLSIDVKQFIYLFPYSINMLLINCKVNNFRRINLCGKAEKYV